MELSLKRRNDQYMIEHFIEYETSTGYRRLALFREVSDLETVTSVYESINLVIADIREIRDPLGVLRVINYTLQATGAYYDTLTELLTVTTAPIERENHPDDLAIGSPVILYFTRGRVGEDEKISFRGYLEKTVPRKGSYRISEGVSDDML